MSDALAYALAGRQIAVLSDQIARHGEMIATLNCERDRLIAERTRLTEAAK